MLDACLEFVSLIYAECGVCKSCVHEKYNVSTRVLYCGSDSTIELGLQNCRFGISLWFLISF